MVSTNYPRKINTNQAAFWVVSSSAEDTVILMKQGRVTEKEKKILELLLEDPAYTYQELASRLSISRKSGGL